MHLIQKVQDNAHALGIYTKVLNQIADQFRARDVRLGKCQLGRGCAWNQPLLFDPHVQSSAIEVRAIKKLEPGHTLRYRNGEVTTQRYWLPDFSKKLAIDEVEAGEEAIRILREAVRVRLMS